MTSTRELPCRDFVELVTDYLEGALSPGERLRFEEHLAACPGCDTYLEQLRQTIAMLGTLPAEAIPAEARRELLRLYRGWRRG